MKKILMVFLVLLLVFNLSIISFGATTDGSITINDEQNAAAFVYPDEEDTPLAAAGATDKSGVSSSANVADESVAVADETVPEALPKTGGIPEEAFYAVGAILIVGALIISMRKSKTATK